MRCGPWISAACALGLAAPADTAEDEAVQVTLDSGWMRRDWHHCQSPALWSAQSHTMTISTDTSAVLYWQIPTLAGRPLAFGPEGKWMQECGAPPLGFWKGIGKLDGENPALLRAYDYRYVTWQWMVEGVPVAQGDGAVIQLGIAVLKKGGNDLRELVYTWSHSLPEDSVRVQRKRAVPRIWDHKKLHVVVEGGPENLGRWVAEARDIFADYKAAFPKEEPGRIVRIYVKIPRDEVTRSLKASLAEIWFHRSRPARQE